MAFTPEKINDLTSQPLARFSTVSPDGQPDVVPVAFEFDGASFWIGGNGESLLSTRKIRNVVAGHRHVALAIDDLVSFDPFIARSLRVYRRASDPIERVGLVGPGFSTCKSLRSHPGAGTWPATPRATSGTRPAARPTS